MIVKRLRELKKIKALDDSVVREFFNPLHEDHELALDYSLAHALVRPSTSTLPHRFHTASEVYYILRGRGVMHIDEESEEVSPGDVIYIPPQGVQHITNDGTEDLEFLCIVSPSWHPDAEELV
jgi:mannose-6-phosphate isomerase-like protein (cupin superfamily)